MKRSRFFTFLFLISFYFYGQNLSVLDSLLACCKKQGNDTLKVQTLLDISNEYCRNSVENSLAYAQQALKLAEALKWEKGIAISYFRIGYAYGSEGKFSMALNYRLKELEKWEQLKNKNKICIVLGTIGISYSDQGDNLNAMKYYIRSLKLAEEIGDVQQEIYTLCNIAIVYEEQKNFKKAFEYNFKSLKLAEENKYEESIAMNRANIGNLYLSQNNYEEALKSYLIALEIDKRWGNKGNISALLANIGDLFQEQSDSLRINGNDILSKTKSDKALEYYFVALKYTEELGNKYLQAFTLGNVGNIYVTRKEYKKAEEYLEKSIEVARTINSAEVIMDDHQRFYDLYKRMDDPAKALGHYEKYIAIKDSVYSADKSKAVSELQIKFDTEKKEAENKTLLQENELQSLTIKNNRLLLLGSLCLSILVLSLAFLIVRQNKLKSQQLTTQFEQKLLRTQMNPHFIFNSLASIESFIYDHEPKEAGIYLSSFSRLMRLILENSASEYISLEKEIETLNYYLTLQKMRLDDNLSYVIDVDKEIDPEQMYLPPMLTQPFIENAIEHGFRGSKQKGDIKIFFKVVDNNLQVQILDNGIGIEKAQQQKDLHKTHKSIAMQITSERLTFLNKSKKKKLSFTIYDISNEQKGNTGTKIIFLIPV
jgi:tetratricopeptide (TPR) repeat protein